MFTPACLDEPSYICEQRKFESNLICNFYGDQYTPMELLWINRHLPNLFGKPD